MAKDDYLKLKYLKDRSKKLNLKFSLPRDAKNNLQFVFRKNFGKKIVVCLIFLIFEKNFSQIKQNIRVHSSLLGIFWI